MSIFTRYYIGKRDNGRWDDFEWDEREEPTPESTGYEVAEGPFDSLQEAKEGEK